MTSVVVRHGMQIKCSDTVVSPGRAGSRRLVCHTQLPCGMDGVEGKIVRGAMQTMAGRDGGIRGPRAEVIERELNMGEEIIPPITGEGIVGGGEGGDQVVFSRPDVPFSGKGAVVVGRCELVVEVVGAEHGGE